MSIFKQFIKSLFSPKHIAAFRMQGIGKTINYLFFLALLMCVPMIVYMFLYVISGSESAKGIVEAELPVLALKGDIMPVVFVTYYLLVSFILFVKVSIFGGTGLLIARILKKRAEYRHTFRMAAYAVTLPAIITIILELAGWTLPSGYLLDWLITGAMLYAAVRYLPGAPK
ncbi:hypothetical protein BTO30_05250 [Domibacillus antri]|uniref:DUF1189 domain-containing protein n=1 Tax=Domibacillus antri TaxID=1714264 RepID=A0A1Q8Q7U6_9BACI|nr:DUF1189 family protein [Domibacillus antri]OLN23371.1 hypothetical protein BTO30_05250 [Domibacillus antri]